jgi:Fic family protein
MFKPKYKITDDILRMLTAIAGAKVVIDQARILPLQEIRLRRQALIRMTHSSTAIEGNRLNVKEVGKLLAHEKIDAPERDIHEVENYLKALKYIEKVVASKKSITEKVILHIHKLVTDKTLPKEQSGCYRKNPIYVVKKHLGFPYEVVYTGPNEKKVPGLCRDLITWIRKNERQDTNPILISAIAHLEIAAIHPFNDGNGRTARALATLILYKMGYDFRRLFALEDYYNEDRPSYYAAINTGEKYHNGKADFTPWLSYFVGGFREEIDNTRRKILTLSKRKLNKDIGSKIFLSEDQLEILDFVDQLGKITIKGAMDITKSPKRTAQLKLQKLKKLGMIKQVGKGPSSAYALK